MTYHEKLIIYQKAITFAGVIYALCRNNRFIIKDRNIQSQIQRAAVSISSNIAEGAARGSRRDYTRFLYIARGSVSEVQSILRVCQEIGYINPNEIIKTMILSEELCKMISGLIKRIITSKS